MPRINHSISGEIRQFSFWLANRTLGRPLLDGLDYRCIFEEPSALEQVYAIFVNVLDLDESGRPTNTAYAQKRAAQYIRQYIEGPNYIVEPPFEDWEVQLH